MEIRYVKLDKDSPDLAYANPGDVAFDLRNIEPDYLLKSMEKKVFRTGIKMEIPEFFVGNIRDRSGMAAKNTIHTMAGVIDPGFRGEIGVVLINLGNTEFKVEKYMRIAQMLIQPVEIAKLHPVTELSETKRGDGAWGSTGTK
jgi:dUTP pyrophosphatase